MASPTDAHSYTRKTRDWLDETFSLEFEAGKGYISHQPIDGFGSLRAAPCQAQRLARTARVLRFIARETPRSFLDVGAAEAYTADLVRQFLGCPVATCDLSREACLRGQETFGIPTVASNAARLPFEDAAFDVVLCSEVLEHLEDPFSALRELVRVTGRVLILTTQECGHFECQRRLELKLRHFNRPHLELNWWMPGDFHRLLGGGDVLAGSTVETHRQIRPDGWPGDDEKDLDRVKAWLRMATDPQDLNRRGVGVIALWRREGSSRESGEPFQIDAEELWETLIQPRPTGRPLATTDALWLEGLLRCPVCLGKLEGQGEALGPLRCCVCDRAWDRYHGLPDLTVFSSEGYRDTCLADEAYAEKLRALFDPCNSWSGRRALMGRTLLAGVEMARDLWIGRGLRRSVELLGGSLREVLQSLDPRREGWLVRRTGQPEVYRIEKGRRRHIRSPVVFHQLGYRIEQVHEVDDAWMDGFPEGEPIDRA